MKMLSSAFTLSLALSFPALAASPLESGKLNAEDRKLIVEEVIQYFKDNPSDLVKAIVDWREKAQTAVTTPTLPLLTSGNQAGDVTIFEFPDYGCSACNKVSQIIDKIASEDNGVGIVHHDLPRSSANSLRASLEIIAVNAAGADWRPLRNAYIAEGVAPETRLKALHEIGQNPDKLNTANATTNIRSNKELAAKTGLQSQPAIVIAVGDRVQALNGEITENNVRETIASLRSTK